MLDKAKEDGVIAFDGASLQWKHADHDDSMEDAEAGSGNMEGQQEPESQPQAAPAESDEKDDEAKAYRHMLACEKKLKKARKKWKSHTDGLESLSSEADELQCKLDAVKAKLGHKCDWIEWWSQKQKECHAELEAASKAHKDIVDAKENASESEKGDECKDIFKDMGNEMLQLLDGATTQEDLQRRSGSLQQVLEGHLWQLLQRRQSANQDSASASPFAVKVEKKDDA